MLIVGKLVHIFGEVSTYFWEVRAYFRSETSLQNFKTSFEKFGGHDSRKEITYTPPPTPPFLAIRHF